MELERRALYNLLRLNWQSDPTMKVEEWQVEDYRSWTTEALFAKLVDFGFSLSEGQFCDLADEFDTPEELTTAFIHEETTPQVEDHLYLVVFELWRRLMPEQRSLSVFCDELDHLIHRYDLDPTESPEELERALAELLEVLDENSDEGFDPQEAFELLTLNCANDIESFLYDFIADQIDANETEYAQELLEDFAPYIGEDPWFLLLEARAVYAGEPELAAQAVEGVVEELEEEPDPELYLELIEFLAQSANQELFVEVVCRVRSLLKTHQEVADLLGLVRDYFLRLGHKEPVATLETFLSSYPTDKSVVQSDDSGVALLKTLFREKVAS
jgi:hypothetical protein